MLTRLLALIALVLMPFGMGMAPAAAAQPSQQHHSVTPAATHCPDPDFGDNGTTDQQVAGCTVTCAAIVAPAPTATVAPAASPPPPVRPLAQRGSGLHPEAATPPPKRI